MYRRRTKAKASLAGLLSISSNSTETLFSSNEGPCNKTNIRQAEGVAPGPDSESETEIEIYLVSVLERKYAYKAQAPFRAKLLDSTSVH